MAIQEDTQTIVYTIRRVLYICLLVGGSAMSSSSTHQLRIIQAILYNVQSIKMFFVVVCLLVCCLLRGGVGREVCNEFQPRPPSFTDLSGELPASSFPRGRSSSSLPPAPDVQTHVLLSSEQPLSSTPPPAEVWPRQLPV